MKQWRLGILGLMMMGLSACSSYYYSTLSSNDGQGVQDEAGDFVQETDTVRIAYSFNGEDAPVSITLQNKSDVPLYIDWARSSLIIEDVATSYYDTNVQVSGSTESESFGSGRDTYRYSNGSFDGNVALPRGFDFIPPHSKIEKSPLRLTNFTFDDIPKEAYSKEKLTLASGSTVEVRSKYFTEEESPLRFRSYLTLYAGNLRDEERKPMAFERQFYVSRLLKTGNLPPERLLEMQRKSGNLFYIQKKRGVGTGVLLGTIAIGVAGGVISVAVGHDSVEVDF